MTEANAKRRTTLADSVYHSLFSRIVNGDYPANQKLPTEMKLSQEYGVSRPILAERRWSGCERRAWLDSRQGAGSYVRASTAAPVPASRASRP